MGAQDTYCNPVHAGLVDVHIELAVFEVFPKCAYKCIIDLAILV